MARSGGKATIDARDLDGLDKLLADIPPLLLATGGPLDKAVSKAGTVVARRARQLAPDSRKTGSRAKQTAEVRAAWGNKLRNTIRVKTKRYPTTALAIVGPTNPDGNQAHFMQEKGRRMVLWGKSTMVSLYRIVRDWIVQAFDETKPEQFGAMEQSLRSDLDKVMRGQR